MRMRMSLLDIFPDGQAVRVMEGSVGPNVRPHEGPVCVPGQAAELQQSPVLPHPARHPLSLRDEDVKLGGEDHGGRHLLDQLVRGLGGEEEGVRPLGLDVLGDVFPHNLHPLFRMKKKKL